MFKVSQEIYVNASDSVNHSKTYGNYQKLNVDGGFDSSTRQIFVAPELSEIRKVQVLHFPEKDAAAVTVNVPFEFVIVKNGAHGNVAVKLVTPSQRRFDCPLSALTSDSYDVRLEPTECGLYYVHIRLNDVELPLSPLTFDCKAGEGTSAHHQPQHPVAAQNEVPAFKSNAGQVQTRGLGLHQISIEDPNEFTVDASRAGNNILFVAICGPDGCQCDEVAVRHVGDHVYTIIYRVRRRGEYVVVIKWGEDHIPRSPFQLTAR